jgi:RimJ/RimL family protein N-acetyltransferase
MDILLETERLYLRRFRPDDAPLLFELDNDPEVMRFISKGEPTPLARIVTNHIPRFLREYAEFPPRGIWAVHIRESDEFAGWLHLRPDKISPNEMELGYRLKRSVWGRGLATEGARTLIGNIGSQRVMQKAGLLYEADFIYGIDILPGWGEDERRGVKYSVGPDQWIRAAGRTCVR